MTSTNWVYTLVRAVHEFGDSAHVRDLQKSNFVKSEQSPQKDLAASIRGSVHDYCSDHSSGREKGAKEGNARDVFEKVAPATWKIRRYDNPFVRFALRQIDAEQVRGELKKTGEDETIVHQLLGEMENDKDVFVREHWRSAPQSRLFGNQAFSIAHADRSAFEGVGLRPFFEYRDLGIMGATEGSFGAHVIRAVPGMESLGTWHSHDLNFQMVYVTEGWVVFEYEGEGEHVLRAGSCVLQPSGIRHREVRHSDDMELIEITSPAGFETHAEDAP